MVDKIVAFIFGIFKNDYLTVLFISAFPLIELKGAIPVGLKAGLPLVNTAVLSYIGSSLVCVPLFFLLLPVFGLLKKIKIIRRFVEKTEGVLYGKAEKLAEKASSGKISEALSEEEKKRKAENLIVWALFAFVAIPLPMTGIWTGTAIAVFLGVKFRKAFLALVGGNFVAGALVTLLTFLFKDQIDLILLVLAAIAVIMLVLAIVKVVRTPELSASKKAENALTVRNDEVKKTEDT